LIVRYGSQRSRAAPDYADFANCVDGGFPRT
jgi:hypothetical protein